MIHKFKINDTNIVLDVNSSLVHVVHYVVFELLDYDVQHLKSAPDELKRKYGDEICGQAYALVTEMIENEELYSKDVYSNITRSNLSVPVKAVCMHISHDCDLRCDYCFASKGSFKGARNLMSYDVAKATIDFVIKNSFARKNIEIDFFGGEPLLNFEVVKQTVLYAKEQEKIHNKNFRFTITTNGIKLDDDKKEFINQYMSNVVLSIDGRKEVNDTLRIKPDKSGTYDEIVPKFIDMANARNQDNYYVRGTFTAFNLDFSNDVLHLADLGFQQISIEPVVLNAKDKYAIQKEHLPIIFEEYEKLANEYVNRIKNKKPFNFFHFMIDLEGGPCAIKLISGCGSGSEYISVTPNGNIYPCHQFADCEEYKMGSVLTGEFNKEMSKQFLSSDLNTKKDCKDCWAKFYCGGGCPANAYKFNNDINKPYEMSCELLRKRVECALYIKSQIM